MKTTDYGPTTAPSGWGEHRVCQAKTKQDKGQEKQGKHVENRKQGSYFRGKDKKIRLLLNAFSSEGC